MLPLMAFNDRIRGSRVPISYNLIVLGCALSRRYLIVYPDISLDYYEVSNVSCPTAYDVPTPIMLAILRMV